MTTLLGYDKVFLDHRTGDHPECPARLISIVEALRQGGVWDDLVEISRRVEPGPWIALNHSQEYIDRLQRACRNNEAYIDSPDSAICPESYEVARVAVSVVLAGCDMIMAGKGDNGFCAVRPPGHHGEKDRSMGFCLFNNIAIAGRYLQKEHGLKKILILDWDVHHGNGTEHSFEEDDSVFYCSLHQDPATLYPGTGWAKDAGLGLGRGYTLNLPQEPGTGDDKYLEIFQTRFLPEAYKFKPDFVLISAGFDGHRRDPLAQLNLTEKSYNQMTVDMKELAQQCCQGRLLSLLEGGYDLKVLGDCVLGHIKGLMN